MLGFLTIFIIVLLKLFVQEFQAGWVSNMAVIVVFSGLQLLALGLLGEYVGRIFMLLNKTPQYAIRQKYNCKSEQ